MKSFIGLAFICFSLVLFAQKPTNKGVIVGKVIDFSSKKPVEYATVAVLLKKDSSLVSGTVSSPEGIFTLSGLSPDDYILQVTFIGYNKKYFNVTLPADKPFLKLNDLYIQESSVNLNTVTITAEKPLIENKIDKKVFNVSQSIAAASGTTTDILKQVPSVSVDAEGNVSLRGSDKVVFLINGKPSSLSSDNQADVLKQMPANMIESVEVITNPSAKYDPDGVTGIINIVLKKDAKLGFNGSAGFNTSYNNKYNGQVTLGYGTGKFNINGSYSGRFEETSSHGFTNRSPIIANDSAINLNQKDTSRDIHSSHMGRIGMDYSINDKNSIGLVSSFMYRNRNDLNWNYYKMNNNLSLNVYENRSVLENGNGMNSDNNMYYIKKFIKPQQELKINATFADSRNDRNIDYKQIDLMNGTPNRIQRDHTISDQRNMSAQADYTHPFSEKTTLETGWKSISTQISNNYTFDSLISNNWINATNKNNIFNFNEQIHAVYATFKQEIGKLGYQVGLRGEYYSRQFSPSNNTFKSILQPYPTLHLQYKITEAQNLQLSYSRRVNRPSPQQLNPMIRFISPNNLSMGNPYLNPEYVNSIEFGHLLKSTKNSLTSTIFYRYTENQISRKQTFENALTYVTFINLNSSKSYGFEMTGIYYLARWWFLNANGSIFNYQIKTDALTKEKVNYQLKIISNISIPTVFSFQLSGFYRSGMITPQGEMRPFYSIDAGLRKDLFKGKATVSLTVSDVFNTMLFHMNTGDVKYNQEMERKRESRIIYLGFTYRFGQSPKKKPERPQQEGSPDMNAEQMY